MIAIDIETIPNHDMVHMLPPMDPLVIPDFQPKLGNLVDPVKMRAKEAEQREKHDALIVELKAKREQEEVERIQKLALDPLYGRLCSYATYGSGISDGNVLSEISDDAERALVIKALSKLKITTTGITHIITWNGISFDLPFLYKRAMMLGINLKSIGIPPLVFWTKRYYTSPHCDLMQVFCNWYGSYKLDMAAAAVCGEHKIDIDVTTFVDMIKQGRGSEILTYNKKDAKLTYELYEKAQGYLF